jgi:hypothetical protein
MHTSPGAAEPQEDFVHLIWVIFRIWHPQIVSFSRNLLWFCQAIASLHSVDADSTHTVVFVTLY